VNAGNDSISAYSLDKYNCNDFDIVKHTFLDDIANANKLRNEKLENEKERSEYERLKKKFE
jgi:hypothetical protein